MALSNGYLWQDLKRAYALSTGKLGGVKGAILCLVQPGTQAIVVFRFGQWSRKMPLLLRLFLDPVYHLLFLMIRILWGIEIPRNASIGPGLYIGHFGGITISSGAVIGKDCNLSQGITIGVSGEGEKRGIPVIGDDVYIAPGARVFGKIKVGNNVKIGANAVIHEDIPDNAIAVLNPGYTIVSYKGNRKPVSHIEK